jgi:hypothetical protein
MAFKKNVAASAFPFLLVSATDGSAITSGTVNFRLCKDGTQSTPSRTIAHEGSGQWTVNLTATDMNADLIGVLLWTSASIPVHFTIRTVAKLVNDLNDFDDVNDTVNVGKWLGTAVTNSDGRPSVDATSISASTVAANNVEANIGNLNATISSRSSHSAANVASVILATPTNLLDTDVSGRVDVGKWIGNTAVAVMGLPKIDVGTIEGSTASTKIQTAADAALIDNHLDHLLKVDTGASLPGAAGSIFKDLLNDDAGTWQYSINALELAPTGGSAPTVAQIADAVWDEDATGHQTLGTFGKAIGDPGASATSIWNVTTTNLNAAITTRSSHSAANVASVILATPTNLLDTDVSGRVDVGKWIGNTAVAVMGLPKIDVGTIEGSTASTKIQTAADAALIDNHLDHLLKTSTPAPSLPGAAGSIFDDLLGPDSSVWRFNSNALELGATNSYSELQAAADAALVANHLDHLLKTDTGASLPGAAGAILQDLLEDDGGAWRYKANTLEQAPNDTGTAITSQAVRDAMKLAPTAGSPVAGSIDEHLDNILADTNEVQGDLTDTGRLDVIFDSIKAITDQFSFTGGDVHSTLDGETVVLSAVTHTGAVIPVVSTVTNRVTANTDQIEGSGATAQIADSVWNRDATPYQNQGTFGQAIGDPVADSSTIWGLANTNLDAAVSTRATPVQVKTEVDLGLRDIHLDHLLAVDTGALLPGAAGSILQDLLEDDAGTWRYTANTLEEAPNDIGTCLTSQNVRDAMKLAPSAGSSITNSIDWKIDNIPTVDLRGPGATLRTICIDDINALDVGDAAVWITTDVAGANVVAGTRHTNDFGQVEFLLDAGTYYVWVDHAGYIANNPYVYTIT